jgi:hypothetical protein
MHTVSEKPFRLFIDKISLTCNETDPNRVDETCRRLIKLADTSFTMNIKSGLRHRLQCAIRIPGCTPSLLFQAGPRHSDISHYRFELNPSLIGPEGLDQISSFIDTVTDTGSKVLFANGKVTRIDIALDLMGLSLDEVIVRSMGQRKHGVYTNGGGRPETVYLGSAKANRTVAYTKNDEDEDTKFLRIERRMKPYCQGHELPLLPNPFSKVQMISTKSLLPHLDGMIPRQFFDSVRLRGLGHALADLPPGQRRKIKSVMADPDQSLLPSIATIWKGWPHLLNDTGLGHLCQAIRDQQAAE